MEDKRTVGVEEELLLIDPETRQASPRSDQVLEHLPPDEQRDAAEDLDHELFRHQLETRTPPAVGLDELREHLVRGRRFAAEAAARVGLATAASGTSPLESGEPQITRDDRYLDMVGRYGEIARPGGTCGMHVHVHVASDEEGVRAIDATAPWLPLVLAASANSPYFRSRDTGYASWRSQIWARWPSAGPTETFGSVERYRLISERMIASGAARDPGMLYFDARLSADHPTVEVRISDVCTAVDDAVLVAALLRALITWGAETRSRRSRVPGADEPPVWCAELLRAAQWRAARYGLAGELVSPTTGQLVPARAALDDLVDLVREQLEAAGDLDRVRDGLPRVLAGGGATRQRQAYERTGSLSAVVDDLVERTNAAAVG